MTQVRCSSENEPQLSELIAERDPKEFRLEQSPLERVLASKTLSPEAKAIFQQGWNAAKRDRS